MYIELTGGEKIEDAIQKMYNVSNSNSNEVNKYNSAIKSAIDSWYETNLSSLSNYLDENEVYCNDRSILSLNGWSTTGDATSSPTLRFTYYDKPLTNDAKLTCTNITDRFSVNNNYAKLKYPIGLLTEAERALMQQNYAKSGKIYRLGTPYAFNPFFGIMRVINAVGQSSSSYNLNSSYGIRPVITLKPDVRVSGEGTYDNPYIVKIETTEEPGE